MQILAANFNQISFSDMSSKKRKYDESYMQYGFTPVIVGGVERPQCVLCKRVLSNDSMRPVKLKQYLQNGHPQSKDEIKKDFLYHCNSRYVGRTTQRLQQRIKQHVPKTILQEHISQNRSTLASSCKPITSFKAETSFSAIGQHLLQNPTCAREYNDNKFSILARGRTSFYLSTLEATYIKTSKPNLCKQKEFVYGVKITH